jgi:HNH endonuclease
VPDSFNIPEDFIKKVQSVKNKRARFVLEKIIEKGFVTTEEINNAGYDHPPRAARDVRELGFPLQTIKVKHTITGRGIAAYKFDEGQLQLNKAGRNAMPKKIRDSLINKANNKCQICGAKHNLQVDHRIPYEVAGETEIDSLDPYQVLCGSCNRKKSWDCEQCENWLSDKSLDICRSCYWADSNSYLHVAMHQQRRAEIVWVDEEVNDFEKLKVEAEQNQISVPEQIKRIIKKD